MPLHLHHATTTDVLADALAELLAVPLDDPFAEEVVVVPARGVERWLTQRLSHRLGTGDRGGDGVCAGVRFLNPRSLVTLLTGTERDDPWDADRLVWPLLEVVDRSLDEPWCATLATHLGRGADGEQAELRRDRRYSVVRRLAGLFASYAVQRPVMLSGWADGQDTDGTGQQLAEDLRWQPELWRRLVAAVPAPPPDLRHREVLDRIRAGAPLALPDRLSMFGHTRMAATELELLRAVGEVREVHLWLPQPSPAAWDRLTEVVADGPVRRVDDRTGRLVRHPLLSSLGRDSRELQRSLALLGPLQVHQVPTDGPTGSRTGAGAGPATLLARLQAELRDDAPAGATAAAPAPADRSVQVHACHGATRQVEVLREVLVGLLEDDPTLEPRDVLVMCPDVEGYAPLFSAVFGLGNSGDPAAPPAHPAHQLRVRLADRGLRSTNPLLAMAATLVDLAGGRGTASEVLDLVAAEPVRHRFGLGDDDLATMTSWVQQAGVRWGLNESLRATYKLSGFPQNTWRAGLDRLLLGVAMAEDEGCALGPCLPLDDVGSAAVELAGSLAEVVARLERRVTALRAATTLEEWVHHLRDGVLELGSVTSRDGWQVAQLERELDQVLEAAGTGSTTELRLADVRTLLELRLQPRPTRANFRTGNLTVATLVPMRSVPHRVVCLVGLDDGVFPRTTISDGDDVLARDPLTGERDPRSEDRQLLLDAVLAAGETLVVTYTGANEHSGQQRPPAVPLGELLDTLERMAPGARDTVLVSHPLQPFDARNFTAGQLGTEEPFSFDRASLDGARASAGERRPRAPLLTAPLPAPVRGDVTLAELQAFLSHPVRGFLRQRLDVGVPQEYDEVDDALPVELDSLAAWEIGDRVLRRAIAGAEPSGVFLAEQLRGDLPPLRLGERILREDIVPRVDGLFSATAAARGTPARAVDVTVDLGDGRRLTGVVPDVRGNRIVRVGYSNLSPKHRLGSWVDLLALSAGLPDHSWTASTYGWHRSRTTMRSLIQPLDHRAVDLLRELVDVYDRGRCEPLPAPPRTMHAWADAVRAHKDPYWPARNAWETQPTSPVPGERDDPPHVRVYGRDAPFDCLLQEPRHDEQWSDQRHRMGQYALRIWQPVFEREQVAPA